MYTFLYKRIYIVKIEWAVTNGTTYCFREVVVNTTEKTVVLPQRANHSIVCPSSAEHARWRYSNAAWSRCLARLWKPKKYHSRIWLENRTNMLTWLTKSEREKILNVPHSQQPKRQCAWSQQQPAPLKSAAEQPIGKPEHACPRAKLYSGLFHKQLW